MAKLCQQADPTVEAEQGALSDLLIQPNAAVNVALLTLLDRWRKSTHLSDLAESTKEIDGQLLEYVAGNYRIERKPGARATGQILIVVSERLPFAIPAGGQFEVEGFRFIVPWNFSARLTMAYQGDSTDRVLTKLQDEDGQSRYGIIIEAVAEEMSASGNMDAGTTLTPLFHIPSFVRAAAYSSFNNGVDPESNVSLANRVVQGITVPQLSSRSAMSAALKHMFPEVVDDSVVGLGDPEMIRDKNLPFPVSLGGKADWYVKTSAGIIEQTVSCQATLTEKINGEFGVWRVTFGRDEYPGLYTVTSVKNPKTNTQATILAVTREKDVARDAAHRFIPEIRNDSEAAFTAYQTLTVTFRDTNRSVSELDVGASADYLLSLEHTPLIGEIQEFVTRDTVRPVGSDILVKAPVPCRVSVQVAATVPVNAPVDATTIKQAICSHINSLGFTGYISGTALIALIYRMLPRNSYIQSFSMNGRTQLPSGEYVSTSASDHLEIDIPPYATAKTVCFYTSLQRISFTSKEIG